MPIRQARRDPWRAALLPAMLWNYRRAARRLAPKADLIHAHDARAHARILERLRDPDAVDRGRVRGHQVEPRNTRNTRKGAKRDPSCPVCGENPTITEYVDYVEFCSGTREPA